MKTKDLPEDLLTPKVRTEQVWYCDRDQCINRFGPTCYWGGTHRRIIVTTTTVVTEGWER